MPIYEYACTDCGERIERLQRIDDPTPGPCEACGGSLKRLVSAPAFQFKGTGWYVTDYADRKGAAGGEAAAKNGAANSGAESKDGTDTSSSTQSDSSKTGTTAPKSKPAAAESSAKSSQTKD